MRKEHHENFGARLYSLPMMSDMAVNVFYVYTIDEWKAVAEAGETFLVEIDAFS